MDAHQVMIAIKQAASEWFKANDCGDVEIKTVSEYVFQINIDGHKFDVSVIKAK